MKSQNSKKSNFPSNFNNFNKSSNKNTRMKNLSPAKKFRLRLRLEKFQKRWQSREEYFEHDTRDNNNTSNRKNKKKTKFYNNNNNRTNKNFKRPKINNSPSSAAALKQSNEEEKSHKLLSKIDSVDSIMAINQSLVTSHDVSKIIQQSTTDIKNNSVSDLSKCCCHCTCTRNVISLSTTKRKPRRKLSSPYLGDFDILQMNNNNNGNCDNAAATKHVTVMTTQQQHHKHSKYIEASSSSSDITNFNHHQLIETPKVVKFLAAQSMIERRKIKRINGKRFENY